MTVSSGMNRASSSLVAPSWVPAAWRASRTEIIDSKRRVLVPTGSSGPLFATVSSAAPSPLSSATRTGAALTAVAQVDQQRAQEYFKEAQALCERDGGRLWGVSICAPMV